MKSPLPLTYFSVTQLFWDFAKRTAVSLPPSVQNFKTIVQLKQVVFHTRLRELLFTGLAARRLAQQISRKIQTASCGFEVVLSHWNFTSVSAAMLSMRLSNVSIRCVLLWWATGRFYRYLSRLFYWADAILRSPRCQWGNPEEYG